MRSQDKLRLLARRNGAATLGVLSVAAIAAWQYAAGQSHGGFDPSRTYTIGTDNTYPYHYLNADGLPEGMVAEIINEAADRSGIRLRWVMRREGPFRALTDERVELWPLLAVQSSGLPFHLSRPFLRNSYIALVAAPRAGGRAPLEGVRRVSLAGFPLVTRFTKEAFPRAVLVPRNSREEAAAALCRGESDAMVTESRVAQQMALQRPPGCEGKSLEALGLNLPQTALGIASLPEPQASAVADRLREEIDAMMADGAMPRLLRRWNYYYSGEADTVYQEMQARQAKETSLALAAVLAMFTVLLLVLLVRVRRAQRAAMAANAAKSQFLARMSHEIRTPLHGIIGIGDLLSKMSLDAEVRQWVDMLNGSGRTLLAIVNDVLDLARIERGLLELHEEDFDPSALIAGAVRVFEPQAARKGLRLDVCGLTALPARIRGDEGLIRQVLSNLVGNAVKFTKTGSIDVRAVAESPGRGPVVLRLEVKDSGIGIAPESQAKIFDKFQQADSSISTRFGGSGLGLAIAREIVQFMGGRIGVESSPGAGSTFWFTVPLKAAQIPAQLAALDAAVSPPEEPAGRAGARLLLVEDNPVNQRIAEKLLTREGHAVTTVTDGAGALRTWEHGAFDAIFMDCHMPVMNGYEATAEIRRREGGRERIPIIALTAAAMKGEREHCLAAGMDDYLAKPIEAPELHRVLAQWVTPRVRPAVAPRAPRL